MNNYSGISLIEALIASVLFAVFSLLIIRQCWSINQSVNQLVNSYSKEEDKLNDREDFTSTSSLNVLRASNAILR